MILTPTNRHLFVLAFHAIAYYTGNLLRYIHAAVIDSLSRLNKLMERGSIISFAPKHFRNVKGKNGQYSQSKAKHLIFHNLLHQLNV